MRKLIVLIMTSVLATGAVANADQVTVVENPNNFILINGVFDTTGTKIPNGGEITPKFMPSNYFSSVWGSDEALTMSADVYDDGNLEQVAFCFYDSNAIAEGEVNNNCDKLSRDASSKKLEKNYSVADGGNRPSALSALWIADLDQFLFLEGDAVIPTQGNIATRADRHTMSREDEADKVPSVVSPATSTLNGTPRAVERIEVKFALSDLAAKSDGWTFRVLAEYRTGTTVTEVINTSPETFKVKYVGTVDTVVTRDNVVWGNVAADSQKTLGSLRTGKYRANNTSDASLRATKNWDGNDTLSWGTDSSPTGTNISMACNADQQDQVFMGLSAKRFLTGVPSLLSAPTPISTKVDYLDMDDHECTLYVGPDVQPNTYDTIMEVGILEVEPVT